MTALLLYKSGFEVGKYISIETKIAKTKLNYYEALQDIDEGWHEGDNDVTPFIKYLLGVILACYRDFENRLELVEEKETGSGNGAKCRKGTNRQIYKSSDR